MKKIYSFVLKPMRIALLFAAISVAIALPAFAVQKDQAAAPASANPGTSPSNPVAGKTKVPKPPKVPITPKDIKDIIAPTKCLPNC
ncbi:MAG: hypothetical protein HY036_01200 [Nitrospirae bacterium]|nr:hypothetical protein [Nitrospirota bacterium]MBI3351174.1 hypothetical protein [Nitrospirota bacterium]